MNRFEYAREVLEWLAQLNRRELLGRYPAWKYPETIPRRDADELKNSATPAT